MRVLITARTLFDKNRQPIPFGRMLVEAFTESGTVILLSEDPDRTRQDLLIHHIRDHDIEVKEWDSDTPAIEAIERVRAGFGFDFLIDSDPAVVTWAYANGLKSLLALEPKFMDPRFRPDGKGVVSWAHMVDEIESQTRMLASKRETWEKSGFNTWE